jgi:hypothetical protein
MPVILNQLFVILINVPCGPHFGIVGDVTPSNLLHIYVALETTFNFKVEECPTFLKIKAAGSSATSVNIVK